MHNAEIVAGYEPKTGLDADAPGQLVRGAVVFVGARLPSAERLQYEACCIVKDYRWRPIEEAQFHHAIVMTGADAVVVRRMEKLYEQVFPEGAFAGRRERAESTKWRESLLPVLRAWLSALRTVSPAKRAAGLLAADHLLQAAEDAGNVPGWPRSPGHRSELQRLGVSFELNEIAGDYYYTRNWEKQSRELDPKGAVGRMAVIGSLLRGYCDAAASTFFRKVIVDGEGLLARGLDSPTAAEVHFMVGDAYSDIVAIAGGDTGPNGEYDPERFRAEAAAARGKALQHFRAGLAVDSTSANAKDAWRQAWRLAGGLLPSERYVCFGD